LFNKMKDFLAYVAQDILDKYGTNLSRTAVVFPNKRASLFLNEHLARLAGHPLWSPAYITISELFRQQTDLQVADPIKLVCDLHLSFCQQTDSTESLDKFYGWGQLLLSDFDDIDKNMADADRVFANLRDIHELDDISYLTDEQRQMIRRFFSNFSDNHNSELKERFLRLWSHFADIYHDFNDRLAAQGLAYEGALYRSVCSKVVSANGTSSGTGGTTTGTNGSETSAFPYDRYLFVGFNLLQKVEQQLFSYLQKEGKARFYWDFDHYYIRTPQSTSQQHRAGTLVPHEAGQYISTYLEYFPNELDISNEDIYGNFHREKHISYLSAPTENIQARYVSTWLREQQRYRDGQRTAIVLANESLLPVVLHCLPSEVEKVNITTGYPLSQTAAASFILLWFDLLLQGRTPRMTRRLRRHPYFKYIVPDTAKTGEENTADNEPRTTNFPEVGTTLSELSALLRQIAQQGNAEQSNDPLFQESLFRAYTLVNRLVDLQQSGDLAVDNTTLQRLTVQLLQQTSIPFHGEPAEGVQIMGVLETRNLDFDHVLLLSCNEGNMPRGINDASFIPHSIRRAYELTTVENKVGIYAYYFHRLLQRATDVTIVYNNSTEDGQRGEMSRFMLQLMVESPHSISQQSLQSGQSAIGWQPAPIEKTPRVMSILQEVFTVLSPSAINKYMRCPLQFYYRYLADLREPDVPDDEQELDNRIFGNIFHEAADIIYHQLPATITRDVLDHLLHNKAETERAVDLAFHRIMPAAPASGLQLINREVIIHYLRQLLQIDRRLAPFTILGLECDVFRPLIPLTADHTSPAHYSLPQNIGGRIDRLDLMNDGTIRVVDYKTGSSRLKPLPDVESIFAPENIHNHADYYLQTFVYADIVSRQTAHYGLQQPGTKVAPALLFIQHAGGNDYDPTLCFGREPICDIADHAARFNELLDQKIADIFSPDVPFTPTDDLRICHTCPYAQMCHR